jgi:hypothetical protein
MDKYLFYLLVIFINDPFLDTEERPGGTDAEVACVRRGANIGGPFTRRECGKEGDRWHQLKGCLPEKRDGHISMLIAHS